MNCLCFGLTTGTDYIFHVQVTLVCWRRANSHCFISHPDMQRVHIRIRVDCNCANIEFFAGPNDTTCDFTAVGHEDFLKHLRTATFTQNNAASSTALAALDCIVRPSSMVFSRSRCYYSREFFGSD
jgi:hypothetical protein